MKPRLIHALLMVTIIALSVYFTYLATELPRDKFMRVCNGVVEEWQCNQIEREMR